MALRSRSRWAIVIVWCAVVLVTAMRHEFYRDEVRALSLTMDAHSLWDLPGLLQNEGHPVLWYVLLWTGYKLTGSVMVLPVISLVVSGAAVLIVVFQAPFPSWLTVLFVFSGLPLYEYSVSARNYGISMLLLFVFAWLYPRREKHPIVLGLVLALLCNTNIHSLLLAVILMGLWSWDLVRAIRPRARASQTVQLSIAGLLMATGIAGSLVIMWPTDQIAASDVTRYTVANVARATVNTLTNPAGMFPDVAPSPPGALWFVGSMLLVGSTLGLIGRPAVFGAALAGIVAFSVLFQVVYPGSYRHQGLLVVFFLALYWIVLARGEARLRNRFDRIARAGLYGGLPAILAILVATGGYYVYADLVHEESASRALGSFLRMPSAYQHSILIGEPDYFLESLPFYADNPIYIVREQRFGKTVRFVRSARPELSLGELLRAAWEVRAREKQDVLIALGHLEQFDPQSGQASAAGSIEYSYGKTFSWSAEDVRLWKASTEPVRRYTDNVIGDERYMIYRLVDSPVSIVGAGLSSTP